MPMEHDGDSHPPPFWYQPPTNPRRRPPRINPVALTLILSILALLAFYLLVPNQILLRPFSVKRTWDSLNILLVLFAILCGLFARRNDDPPPPENHSLTFDSGLHESSPSHSVPAWMNFPDRKYYNGTDNNITGDVSSAAGRLMRSSSSYPDLRQESISASGGRNRARYFDDFEVGNYRFHTPPETFDSRPNRRLTAEREEVEKLEIPDDKFEVQSPPPPKSSTPPPPPPPPPSAATLRRRRSVHSVPRRENAVRRRDEAEVNIASENRRPIPPPAPPPLQPELQSPVEETSENLRRKKSVGATKEIGAAIASMYRDQRKRKKRGIKIRNVHESAAHNSIPIPQSAPPPPPSNLLQNLFKKSGKSKRVHSVPSGAPPPPPPPPPNSIFVNLFKSKGFQPSSSSAPPPPPPPPPTSLILNSLFKKGSINSRRFINALTSPPPPPPLPPPPRQRQLSTGRPPKPFKQAPTRNEEEDTKVFISPPSPLIPLPPPPPPPLEDGDFDESAKPEVNVGPSVYCPSPDVNAKADTFIARLRDEWRLEKVNSVNEKRTSG